MTDVSEHEDENENEELSASSDADEPDQDASEPAKSGRDPVRIATLVVLALCVLFFLLYVRADRVMPYSDQARVSGYTVAVVPQVSGYITEGLRSELDTRNEKINYKIREHSHAKVPVILVVGAKVADAGTVAMRRLGGKDQEILALKEATARLAEEAVGPLAGG